MAGINVDRDEPVRTVYCKEYHQPRATTPGGVLRTRYDRKSSCPSWATDPILQQALIVDALVDTGGATDSQGRPKKLWNAVDGFVFIGVSCNLAIAQYNCYPERPPDGRLFRELERRAERTREEVLAEAEMRGG